jgi:hypothetical protein
VSPLALYRDDGPIASWVARTLAGPGRRAFGSHALTCLVPPLLRVVEYGTLIALTAVADPDALPMCFALLVVLAFHHYDTAYRLRYQGRAPAAWLRTASGGWEGRIAVAGALALAGWLGPGLLVGAVYLGLLYALECALSWARFDERDRPAPLESGDVVE